MRSACQIAIRGGATVSAQSGRRCVRAASTRVFWLQVAVDMALIQKLQARLKHLAKYMARFVVVHGGDRLICWIPRFSHPLLDDTQQIALRQIHHRHRRKVLSDLRRLEVEKLDDVWVL